MKNALLIAALLANLSAPALAQVQLQPNVPVQGRIESGGDGACYILPTTAGSQWQIDLSIIGSLLLGRGGCSSSTTDRTATSELTWGGLALSNPRLAFAAGGGAYVVRVSGVEQGKTYTLTARLRPGVAAQGLLPPGDPIGPWLTAGWTPPSVSSAPANAAEGLRRGNVFKDCADVCPEMVVIPAGSFTMGSPAEEAGRDASEGPRHPVALVNAFAIGRYEVTFAEYDACVTDGGCTHRPNDQGWGRGRRPVVDVNWNDAQAYAAWLSQKTGKRYTLPSESEWEYAARAGANTPWQTGRAILTDDANILNAFGRTVPTGSYPPNAFGLHDVHGNVSEWTLDCLDTGYLGVPNDGSAATSGNCAEQRLNRGGNYASEPSGVRFAYRARAPQTTRLPQLGFRVARAL